jgi:hypothetical protein
MPRSKDYYTVRLQYQLQGSRSPRQVPSYTLQRATRATREVGDLCDLETLRSLAVPRRGLPAVR